MFFLGNTTPKTKKKENKIENANFYFYSGHRWKKTACGVLSWLFEHNNWQILKRILYHQIETPVITNINTTNVNTKYFYFNATIVVPRYYHGTTVIQHQCCETWRIID